MVGPLPDARGCIGCVNLGTRPSRTPVDRSITWATVAIGVTTLLLTLVHYDEKPSGLQLLAAGHARAVWGRPRWETQITGYHEAPIRPTLQFINDHVPADTTITLAFADENYIYPFFDRRLRRRIRFVNPADHSISRDTAWVVLELASQPQPRLPARDWKAVARSPGWVVYKRLK